MRRVVMVTMLLLLSAKNTYGTEWDCTGASNTGTFQRSTDCTMSAVVNVEGTLEIIGSVEDVDNLITITAANNARPPYSQIIIIITVAR
jgi:hypothetical protein